MNFETDNQYNTFQNWQFRDILLHKNFKGLGNFFFNFILLVHSLAVLIILYLKLVGVLLFIVWKSSSIRQCVVLFWNFFWRVDSQWILTVESSWSWGTWKWSPYKFYIQKERPGQIGFPYFKWCHWQDFNVWLGDHNASKWDLVDWIY